MAISEIAFGYKNEAVLEELTIPWIESHFQSWAWQVPFRTRVIDFAGINHKGQLVGIEYKLHNWKRVIGQAQLHCSHFDFVYVLLPKTKFSKRADEVGKKSGVGILVYDGEVHLHMKPRWNRILQPPQYMIIKNYISRLCTVDFHRVHRVPE